MSFYCSRTECRSSVQSLSRVQLFATPWPAAHQVPLSMGILQVRILKWVAWDLPNPGIKPRSPALQVNSLLTN